MKKSNLFGSVKYLLISVKHWLFFCEGYFKYTLDTWKYTSSISEVKVYFTLVRVLINLKKHKRFKQTIKFTNYSLQKINRTIKTGRFKLISNIL